MAWEDRAYNREVNSFGGGGGGRSLRFLLPRTPLAISLILINLAVFLLQATTPAGYALARWGPLTFINGAAFTEPWRWITYQYLHGGAMHFFFNMLGIYFFLPMLEERWGWKRAFAFYTAGGIAAGVTYGLMVLALPGLSFLVGASGSIMAVFGAIAVLNPQMQVLAMMVIPINIRVLAILFAVIYLLSIVGDRDKSDAAHLGGLAFGAAAVYFGGGVFSRVWTRQTSNWQRRQKQRAVRAEQDESEAVDRILQKVRDTGMNSLSRSERQTLKRATERQRMADVARASRGR
jgi:membrane associated rhomboid family serine protease